MKLKDLISTCNEAIADGRETITVVIPGRATANGRRIFGAYGPIGEVICENSKGNCVVRVKAKRILQYLKRSGLDDGLEREADLSDPYDGQ